MKDRIQKSLDEAIGKELENLSDSINETEKEKSIENLSTLYKLRIEEAKIEQAKNDKYDELEIRKAQLDSQAKDRVFNVALQAGLTVGGWLVYSLWFRRGLKFEEEGTVTSPWTRNLISRMFPKK